LEISTSIIIAWGDARIDKQGKHILRSIDDHQLILLNDDAATFLSSSGSSTSSIDLTISSRELGLLANVSTLSDLLGSDHFSVSVVISDTAPSSFRLSHKMKLSDPQHPLFTISSLMLTPTFAALSLVRLPLLTLSQHTIFFDH